MGTIHCTHTVLIMKVLILLALVAFASAGRLSPLSRRRVGNIINGKDVDRPGKYPWQGSLQQYEQHICGLSLVAKRWGMTAAHCVDGNSVSRLTVVFGMHDQHQNYGQPKRYNIKKIHQHERYNQGAGTFPQDIALLELTSDVEYNDYVQPIAIDSAGEMNERSSCVISGWGYTIKGNYFQSPNILQETDTSIISQDACKDKWGSSSIYPGVVCVHTGKAGACMGDSGGPLVCKNGGGEYKLVGATSWGSSSCMVSMPSVYTRLSYFTNWISSTSGGAL